MKHVLQCTWPTGTSVLGKVADIGDETFTLHYWKGSYNPEWHPDSYRAEGNEPVPWIQDLRKNAVLLSNIQLSERNRVFAGTKNIYQELQKQVTSE